MDKSKAFERSVDSFAKIYAVVIGLALTESVKTLIAKNQVGGPVLTGPSLAAALPAFVAFLFTVVPFWHGMNRHLDSCYFEKSTSVVQGALILDLAAFLVEASCFLLAAWSLREGLVSFYCLAAVLVIDTLWGFVSHQIHFAGKKSHVVSWAATNLAAFCLAFPIVEYQFDKKAGLLMMLAIVRTVVDYWRGWSFYFPGE